MNSLPWRLAALASFLWLFVCTAAGVLIAVISGEHGSVVFAIFGLLVGISGAIASAALLLWPSFRIYSPVQRTLTMWGAGLVTFVVAGAILSFDFSDLWAIAAWVALPMLGGATLVNIALERKHGTGEA